MVSLLADVELKKLVAYTISKFRRGVGRTRLTKILFLADAEALRLRGRKLTFITWRRWYFGPFAPEVLEALDSLVYEDYVVDTIVTEHGVRYIYVALRKPRIPADAKAIIDDVVRKYGYMSLPDLLDLIYAKWKLHEKKLGEVIL